MKKNDFKIYSFYQFKKIKNPINLKSLIKEFCQFHKLKGTIIIAREGINGTIGGLDESIKIFEKELFKLNFSALTHKFSRSKYMPFHRLKIRNKKEIITFTKKNINVERYKGQFIEASEWNRFINDKDVYLIDVRNDYESQIGSFKGSIKSNTKKFKDFKKFIKNKLYDKKSSKIAMFCTGGIRCEKASAYMKEMGFKKLYQLQGGILKYLEDIPKKKSKWQGECFIFDNRVSVKNEMKKGSYELCHGCRMPILEKDKLSKKFEYGVSCANCYNKLTENKKQNLRQRNKQIKIAKKRGLYNPYIRHTPVDY